MGEGEDGARERRMEEGGWRRELVP